MPPGIIKNLRRLRQKMQNDGQKLCIKHHQHVAKNNAEIHYFGTKNHENSNRSRGVQNVAQSAPKASQIAPQTAQGDFKINEKSTPAPDLRGFGETLIFDDSTMVLLDFSGPDDL